MKKALSYFLVLSMLVMSLMLPYEEYQAYEASLTVGVSASTVNIGDTVTATVKVPGAVSGPVSLYFSTDVFEYVSSSTEASVVGQTVLFSIGKGGRAASDTVTVKLKAKTSGTGTIEVAASGDIYDYDSLEEVSLKGASATVTIENQTTPPENTGGENNEPEKSSDNSLSSLKLSSGTLSPGFKYNVTKYTATVGYDVDKVVVSAKTSNEKATIESVTGDGTVNLEVGENTIQITVKAENGVKATYTIVVTRKAQGEEEPQPTESEQTTPEVNLVLQWNGEQLKPAKEIPKDKVPSDFEKNLLVVNGQQMQGLNFTKGDLKVLYLNNTNDAGSLYVYDEVQQTIYPFIKIESEKNYVMVLLPDEQNAPAPDGFERCTFSIEGKGIVNAFQLKENTADATEQVEESTMTWNLFGAETFYAAEPKMDEFYLIYCMNDNGEKGWYMYDSVEGTVQRYLDMTSSIPVAGDVSEDESNDTSSDAALKNKYAALEKELNAAKTTQYIIIAVAAAVIVILIIIIVVIVLKNRNKDDDFFDEYEDDDDDDGDDEEDGGDGDGSDDAASDGGAESDEGDNSQTEGSDENAKHVENNKNLPSDDIMVDTMSEEDEIEIEFYEMKAETEVEDGDDEIEIEFYNMEEAIVSQVEETEKSSESVPVQENASNQENSSKQETASKQKDVSKQEKKEPAEEIKIVRKPKAVDPTSKLSSKKDDDDDLEFIDFE